MPVKPRPCQRCAAPIPLERLQALPETRLCVQCSAEVGTDFVVSVSSENLAKTSSLKKNYGGLNVSKKRRKIDPKSK